MSDNKDSNLKVLCTCTHPTHFLGRCAKRLDPPERKCPECKRDHLYPPADPIEARW